MKVFFSILMFVLLIHGCSKSDANSENETLVLALPSVNTAQIESITAYSAHSGGKITSDGGAGITVVGICWNTTTNPTLVDLKTSDGSGGIDFTSTLSNLEPETTYYVRGYASNSEGTAYGNEISFTTLKETFDDKIFEGDVLLKNQNEVDMFAEQSYTDIRGSLQILGTEEPFIEDVSELKAVKVISQGLIINQLTKLKNFDGLQNLEYVAGPVIVSGNDALEEIEGLSKLLTITAELDIRYNRNLISINGLNSLQKVRSLAIGFNDSLKSLGTIQEVSTIEFELYISFNDALEKIDGFQNLVKTKVIRILNNDNLVSIKGFKNLTTLDGNLGNAFAINNNLSLEILDAFKALSIIRGNLIIRENPSLDEIKGFDILTSVDGNLDVLKNNALFSITGFLNLEEIIQNMNISYNQELISFPSFENLSYVGGDLTIGNNQNLESVQGFDNLVAQEGFLFIMTNSSLKSIIGFKSLRTKPSSLLIGSNESLEILDCFKSLKSVSALAVEYSPKLTNFCNFQTLFDSGWNQFLDISDNGYNPTYEDFVVGNCKP